MVDHLTTLGATRPSLDSIAAQTIRCRPSYESEITTAPLKLKSPEQPSTLG